MCYPLIVTDLWRNSPSYVPIQVLLHVYAYEDDSFFIPSYYSCIMSLELGFAMIIHV